MQRRLRGREGADMNAASRESRFRSRQQCGSGEIFREQEVAYFQFVGQRAREAGADQQIG